MKGFILGEDSTARVAATGELRPGFRASDAAGFGQLTLVFEGTQWARKAS
jgi:hypothetical protein